MKYFNHITIAGSAYKVASGVSRAGKDYVKFSLRYLDGRDKNNNTFFINVLYFNEKRANIIKQQLDETKEPYVCVSGHLNLVTYQDKLQLTIMASEVVVGQYSFGSPDNNLPDLSTTSDKPNINDVLLETFDVEQKSEDYDEDNVPF